MAFISPNRSQRSSLFTRRDVLRGGTVLAAGTLASSRPMLGLAQGSMPASGVPNNLRCELLPEALGIQVERPRLTWSGDDTRPGAQQAAYQVTVSTTADGSGDLGTRGGWLQMMSLSSTLADRWQYISGRTGECERLEVTVPHPRGVLSNGGVSVPGVNWTGALALGSRTMTCLKTPRTRCQAIRQSRRSQSFLLHRIYVKSSP